MNHNWMIATNNSVPIKPCNDGGIESDTCYCSSVLKDVMYVFHWWDLVARTWYNEVIEDLSKKKK